MHPVQDPCPLPDRAAGRADLVFARAAEGQFVVDARHLDVPGQDLGERVPERAELVLAGASPDQLLRVAVAVAFRRARLQHVYSVLRGKDLESGKVTAARRQEQFDRLAQAHTKVLGLTSWHEFFQCVTAAGFRSRKMITSDNALLYSYTIWLIGRHDFGLTVDELRPEIGRWFFMAHTTGRYSNSPESQMEFDLGRIGSLPPGDGRAFTAELDRIIAANFTGDYWDISLPNRLDTSSSRSPVLFAYQAALNILDAEMLFGDQRIRDLLDPSVQPAKAVDRDNLFHRKALAGLGPPWHDQLAQLATADDV
ncbi:hypothetical protein [Streptomyces sp. NPDC005486]|uniref:hypothetical protein n=1 Tax=Streptomyces sp. NPDC005486 TaxID=3155345 RepID=UPI0033A595DC